MAANLTAWRRADDHYFKKQDALVDAWRSRTGTLPVCLSAPHAVAQTREGEAKVADLYTGGLAEVSAIAADASFIATVGRQTGDPNWDREHPFRDALLGLAGQGVVLDIHGMADDRGVSINIGVGAGIHAAVQRLASLLVEASLKAGILEVGVNCPFAGGERTLTAWLHEHGVCSVQIELARSLRDYAANPEQAARTLDFVQRAVTAAATFAPCPLL